MRVGHGERSADRRVVCAIGRRTGCTGGRADAYRAVEAGRLCRVVLAGIEEGFRPVGVKHRLIPGESYAQVQGQALLDFPAVLSIEGNLVVEVGRGDLGALLRVSVVNAEQRVGERISSIEGIGGGGGEIDIALHVILRIAGIGGALIIDAELEQVRRPEDGATKRWLIQAYPTNLRRFWW